MCKKTKISSWNIAIGIASTLQFICWIILAINAVGLYSFHDWRILADTITLFTLFCLPILCVDLLRRCYNDRF